MSESNGVHPTARSLIKLYRRLSGELQWIEAPPKTMGRKSRGRERFDAGAEQRTGRAAEIREHLPHLAYVIRMYSPTWNEASAPPVRPRAAPTKKPPGGWGSAALDVMGEIDEPLTIAEIAAEICERYGFDNSTTELRQRHHTAVFKSLTLTYGEFIECQTGDPNRWRKRR